MWYDYVYTVKSVLRLHKCICFWGKLNVHYNCLYWRLGFGYLKQDGVNESDRGHSPFSRGYHLVSTPVVHDMRWILHGPHNSAVTHQGSNHSNVTEPPYLLGTVTSHWWPLLSRSSHDWLTTRTDQHYAIFQPIADVANSKRHQRLDEHLIIFTCTIQEISKVVCKKTMSETRAFIGKLMLYERRAVQQAYAA